MTSSQGGDFDAVKTASDRFWAYWSVAALVTFIVLVFPLIVVLGFLLFIIPGVILWIEPPIFFYVTIAALIWKTLPLFRPVRIVLIVIALAAVGIGLPAEVNHRKNLAISEWRKTDIVLTPQARALPDTIAFLFAPEGSSQKDRDEIKSSQFPRPEISCSEICQRLLYNGAVRRVLIGVSPEGLGELPSSETTLTAFYIEKRSVCPTPPATTIEPDLKEDWPERGEAALTNKRVKHRIAGGECLIQATVPFQQAQWVYLERKTFLTAWESNWALTAEIYTLHRFELLRRSGSEMVAVYRATYADSSYLDVPLIPGVLSVGGLPLVGISSGFMRDFDFPPLPGVGALAHLLFGAAADTLPPLESEFNRGGVDICGMNNNNICGMNNNTCANPPKP